MESFFALLLTALLVGGIVGMVPFVLGRYMGKGGLGNLGLLCCILSALLFLWLPVIAAVGFSVAILVKKEDYHRPAAPSGTFQENHGKSERYRTSALVDGTGNEWQGAAGFAAGGLSVSCLAGPLRGQVYPVGREGVMIGREPSCGIRFPDGTPGISARHCQLRWQQGVLMLSDLGSTYGTFLGDGRKLPPNYPVQLAAGSRFYLANVGCLFQVVAGGV